MTINCKEDLNAAYLQLEYCRQYLAYLDEMLSADYAEAKERVMEPTRCFMLGLQEDIWAFETKWMAG